MHCTFYSPVKTKVIDSRLGEQGTPGCSHRQFIICNEYFTTFELAELVLSHVIKSNDRRELFNEEKLHSRFLKTLEKRLATSNDIEIAINYIKSQPLASSEREMPSKIIGNLVISTLKTLDKLGYIYFALVYQNFRLSISSMKQLFSYSPGYKIRRNP